MADITIVNGVYKPTYNWGAPSCIDDFPRNMRGIRGFPRQPPFIAGVYIEIQACGHT